MIKSKVESDSQSEQAYTISEDSQTYEIGEQVFKNLRTQLCPVCKEPMGDMPGTRDAYCHVCGFKDPCCE